MSRLSAQLAQDLAPLSPSSCSPLPRLPPAMSLPMEMGEPPSTLWGVRASDIERYARIAFPLVFVTFHLMYWTILVSISELEVDDLVPLKIL